MTVIGRGEDLQGLWDIIEGCLQDLEELTPKSTDDVHNPARGKLVLLIAALTVYHETLVQIHPDLA